MSHQTFNWQSHGKTIFAQSWQAESPKAVVCLVHGHGEHSSRYEHLATFFNQQGISVMAYDHFGHGKSEGKRGHVSSYEAVLDTIDELLAEASKRFSKLPQFLYGHSMGGNFVSNYVLKRKPDIKGVILSAPWFELAFTPSKADVFLAKIMKRIYPSFTQSSKLDATGISRDPAEVEKYTSDPLVHDKISPVLFLGCHEAGAWALEHASEWVYPLLHLHGTADRIISHEASQRFARQAGGGDISWKSWEALFHELHNEPEKEEVMQVIVDWVLERV